MTKLRIVGVLCCTSVLSGCAGVVTAWKNDPLQSYDVVGPSIYAMTGDRRTAVFSRQNDPLKYCAESLPDAVAAYAASSQANAKASGLKGEAAGEVSIADSTAAGLLQTFQRTENAEIMRQLGWNACLAWAQGAISNQEYFGILTKLVDGGIEVMKVRAAQPIPSISTNTLTIAPGVPAPSPTPKPSPSPTPSPLPSPTPSPTPTPKAP